MGRDHSRAGTPREGVVMARVVVHLDEAGPDKHAAVLRNVANLLDDLGPATEVEVVAHGPGLSLLTGQSGHAATVAELRTRRVRFSACANTMVSQSLSSDDLLAGAGVVPSGLGRLVRAQEEGWAYVRP
ncbi:MAG: DsrE family protein [Candidatus Dormibacteria bacterium]